MPDILNPIKTSPVQDATQPAAQPATQATAQPAAQPVAQPVAQPAAQPMPPEETAPDTTPVLRAAPPPEKESIQEVISTITTNASEVGNWFETNQMQLIACGISALVTILFSIVILMSLRHIVSRGASKLSEGLGKFIHRLSLHISLLFLLTGLSYSNSLVHFS